jgi:hypothetical protein
MLTVYRLHVHLWNPARGLSLTDTKQCCGQQIEMLQHFSISPRSLEVCILLQLAYRLDTYAYTYRSRVIPVSVLSYPKGVQHGTAVTCPAPVTGRVLWLLVRAVNCMQRLVAQPILGSLAAWANASSMLHMAGVSWCSWWRGPQGSIQDFLHSAGFARLSLALVLMSRVKQINFS